MPEATIRLGFDASEVQKGTQAVEKNMARMSRRVQDVRVRSVDTGFSKALALEPVTATLGLLDQIPALLSPLKRGLDFNREMDTSEVGIANVLAKFGDLNAEAAKAEAAKAMQQLIELEPKTAGTMSSLVQGFMATLAPAQAAGMSVQQNIDLVGRFANALANAGIPAEQLGQEMRSIMSGNITADSAIAKVLNLTNADVANAKQAGNLYDMLVAKMGKLGEAGDSAAVTLSSLTSAYDKALASFTKPLFEKLIEQAKQITPLLTDVAEAFQSTGKETAGLFDLSRMDQFLASGQHKKALVVLQSQLQAVDDKIKNMGTLDKLLRADDVAALKEYRHELFKMVVTWDEVSTARAKAVGAKNASAAAEESAKQQKAADAAKQELAIQQTILDAKRKLERDRLQEVSATTPEDRLALVDRQIDAQRAYTGERSSAEVMGDAGATVRQLQAAQELVRLEQQRKALLDEIKGKAEEVAEAAMREGEEWRKQARDRVKKALDADRDKKVRMEAIADLQNEMRLLELRSKGKNKEAEALEKEIRLKQEAARIAKDTGATPQQAEALAKKKMADEERAQKRAEGKIIGHKREKLNDFRGLDAMKEAGKQNFWDRNLRTPGLNALANMQKQRAAPVNLEAKTMEDTLRTIAENTKPLTDL